jgi:heme exporter protein D
MRGLDFSSWQAMLSTLLGLCVVTLVMVGLRLVVMQRVQQRRERENRQINERLRTLIAAYKTLGGSFTGNLAVDPAHKGDLRAASEGEDAKRSVVEDPPGAERRRRVRDAVEAALSDIILLGTEEQVRLAVTAAADLVEGRPVQTDAIVVSLRNFIREVLELDPVPGGLAMPAQGPARQAVAGSRGAVPKEGGAGRGGGQGVGALGGGGAGLASSAPEDPHGEGTSRHG